MNGIKSRILLALIGCAAVTLGIVQTAFASGSGCFVRAYRVNSDNNQSYTANPPVCAINYCEPGHQPCTASVQSGAGVYWVFCKCGDQPDEGCNVMWSGGTVGGFGTTFCSNNCPGEGAFCDEPNWSNGTWAGSPAQWVEPAQDCDPCQS